jgi:hypothetical protein
LAAYGLRTRPGSATRSGTDRGEERAHIMQAIAGIPQYYRRFGYEMAVWMGEGRRIYARDVPTELANGDGGGALPASIPASPAAASDARFLSDLHRRAGRRLGPAQGPVPQATFRPWPVY